MRAARRLVLGAALVAAACGGNPGGLSDEAQTRLDAVFADPIAFSEEVPARLAEIDDERLAWPLVDLLRFHQGDEFLAPLVHAPLAQLLAWEPPPDTVPWVAFSEHLLAEDVPAPPDYVRWKAKAFTAVEPGWSPFFDPSADIDWRYVSWGGVRRDGIVALTDPSVVPAPEGAWLPDDDVVFGVVVGGEARAYPKRVLEVHELVNDTVGGRRLALPYCSLCGAAVAYDLTAAGIDELRTSGLLLRSNKLMYDVASESLFDQFTGEALTGPLRGQVALAPVEVVATRWSAWRQAYPSTTVLAADQGFGTYDADPLAGRDEGSPVFPVGDRDDRLAPATPVLGVLTPDEVAIAFPVDEVAAALDASGTVTFAGVEVHRDGGGLVARLAGGAQARFHEARWFAWSQFRPGTLLWRGAEAPTP